MSLIRSKQEFRTILDFSKDKISKNMVKRALRSAEVREVVHLPDVDTFTFVENVIKIGIYQIQLLFPSVSADKERTTLKEYGGFRVAIYERSNKGKTLKNINLDNSKLFKKQYWVGLGHDYNIRMKNLVDIIMYVKRLDNLKAFS